MLLDVPEGRFVERSICLRHVPPEIDNPLARRAAGQVHAVDPGFQNIGIGPPVRIGREAQPLPSEIAENVERPALGVAHEGNPDVLRNASCPSQVDSGCAAPDREVGMDFVGGLAIHARLWPVRIARAGEADQRHPYRRAVDHPRFIRPRIEDRATVRRGPQGPAIRAAAYRVGRDETDARRLVRCDLLACLHEPVADEIGLARYTDLPCREHPRDVVLPQPADQQLTAEKWRVADHGIGLRPVRCPTIGREDCVPAFDGIEGIENRVGRVAEAVAPHPLDFTDPYRHTGKLGGVGVDLDSLHIRRSDRREPAREAERLRFKLDPVLDVLERVQREIEEVSRPAGRIKHSKSPQPFEEGAQRMVRLPA